MVRNLAGTTSATWVTSPAYNPPAVPSNSTYYLRVRTKDNAGNWASWITLFTLRYDATPPGNPTSANPGCTASSGVWQHTCGNPNFTWSGASDGAGCGVAGYNLYWGTAISGTVPATWTTSAAYNPPAVPSGVPHHLRVQTKDNAGNWATWTTPPLFTLQYDGVPPILSDLTPPNSSIITTAWPMISAALSDPAPGSGIQPLSTTLMADTQVVTPQVNPYQAAGAPVAGGGRRRGSHVKPGRLRCYRRGLNNPTQVPTGLTVHPPPIGTQLDVPAHSPKIRATRPLGESYIYTNVGDFVPLRG